MPPLCTSKCCPSCRPHGKASNSSLLLLSSSSSENILPLTMMTIFFLHYMFIRLLSSLRDTCSQEVGTSHIGFIFGCPSAPMVEPFLCSQFSVCVFWMHGWMMNACPPLGTAHMSNQPAYSRMKLDIDKHGPLVLPCRLQTQLHLPHAPTQGYGEGCPREETSLPSSHAAV